MHWKFWLLYISFYKFCISYYQYLSTFYLLIGFMNSCLWNCLTSLYGSKHLSNLWILICIHFCGAGGWVGSVCITLLSFFHTFFLFAIFSSSYNISIILSFKNHIIPSQRLPSVCLLVFDQPCDFPSLFCWDGITFSQIPWHPLSSCTLSLFPGVHFPVMS